MNVRTRGRSAEGTMTRRYESMKVRRDKEMRGRRDEGTKGRRDEGTIDAKVFTKFESKRHRLLVGEQIRHGW